MPTLFDDDGNAYGEYTGPEEENDSSETDAYDSPEAAGEVFDSDEEPEFGEMVYSEEEGDWIPHGWKKSPGMRGYHNYGGGFPDPEQFTENRDYEQALKRWEADQTAAAIASRQQPVHVHHHVGQGGPGYDPTSDPAALSRAELEYKIAENLNKAAKLRSQMDYKEAEEREQVAGLYQRDLDGLPEHPEVTAGKKAAIAQFEHEIEAVSTPRAFSEMLGIFTGHESKVLTDCRTRLRDFCLYGDKNYFYVQPNDYGTAPPATLKPPVKIEVEPAVAEEIRQAVSYGSTLEEQIRTLHQQLDRRNLLPSTRPKKGEMKGIEDMSQAEYEAWRRKEGGLPEYSSPLSGYGKAAGLRK